ncbi:MAG: 6-pyruvoyl trahydropterin synthase family protein [Flavobacteriales bacterium]
MRTAYITRRETFNAAHKLWNESWSAEKNAEIFGKCAHPNWHGHNFVLFVTVKGIPDTDTGFIINLKKLSDLVKFKIVEVIDHKNLNLDVPFMQGKRTSVENLAIAIWDELYADVEKLGGKLHCVKLHETENNYVEFFG